MRRTVLAKLFATAASGLLFFTLGCTQDRNVAVPQPETIQSQGQAGGCNTPNKDAFVLDSATKSNSSAALASNEKLPPAVQVDVNRHKLLVTRIGVGVQVYDHDSTNGKWTFREPQANLYDMETGLQQGIHFAGPFWTDTDGSRIKAKVSGEADAPTDAERNIKWLRLEAVENVGSNSDVLRQATFIQRVLTYGGQAPLTREPTEGCDTMSVPYTALYVFWGPKE